MGDNEQASLDQLYRCLADKRRRAIIDYLQTTENSTASTDELIDHILEREGRSATPDRETIHQQLYHNHLPLLAQHSVIDINESTETVRYRTQPELDQANLRDSSEDDSLGMEE